MLSPAENYDALIAATRWAIPERFNIGVAVCDQQPADRPALINVRPDGGLNTYKFGDLRRLTNQLANVFTGLGLTPGERVGILLPQAPETAISHIACYKAGLIATPLFTLFGEEALEYRLTACTASLVITDRTGLEKISALADRLPSLKAVLCIEDAGDFSTPLTRDFHSLLEKASADFSPVDSRADDPALIIFTSGTTGQPKGALHAHRVLLGHLPGVEFPHEFFPQKGDLFWTPADWAWIGGLLDVLLPSLYHGIPVLSYRAAKFDPEEAFHLIGKHKIRNMFMPPTALKLMRQVPDPATRFGTDVRSIGSGGESLGQELLDWGVSAFGVTINEFYGQTECNLVVGNCASLMPVRSGSMGRPVPGHNVAIIDEQGNRLAADEYGMIAVARPDPVMFLRYWNNEEATRAKFIGDWLITGDTGRMDEAGYLRYGGRDDDVITSAGYRIGPGEIEDCLLHHEAVAMSGVVGVPDPLRTERVKAYVVLREGFEANDTLAKSLQDHVKTKLAAHEYPREIAFLESLPMTTTGKIMRRNLRDFHKNGDQDPDW